MAWGAPRRTPAAAAPPTLWRTFGVRFIEERRMRKPDYAALVEPPPEEEGRLSERRPGAGP